MNGNVQRQYHHQQQQGQQQQQQQQQYTQQHNQQYKRKRDTVEDGEVVADDNRHHHSRDSRHSQQPQQHSSMRREDSDAAAAAAAEADRASAALVESQLKAMQQTPDQIIEQRRRERAALLAQLDVAPTAPVVADDEADTGTTVAAADAVDDDKYDAETLAKPFLLAKRAVETKKVVVAADGLDDMFSASPVPNVNNNNAANDNDDNDVALGATEETGGEDERAGAAASAKRAADDWDDADGYYKHQPGEVIANQFRVTGVFGKGVFSTVLRAVAVDNDSLVFAIKLIRSNETMSKAAAIEIAVLERLAANDPEQRRHCVQLLARGEHRGHSVMVFEALSMNLRSLVHKFGKSVGIDISAVRVYARQLFTALRHLERSGVVHADIKPDNIVVNEANTSVKLCDFGSAFFAADPVEPTPLLVSRFYRPPEVIMGVPYGCPLDMWSVGVVLAEIFTGKLLFPGASNNAMLKLFLEFMGAMPKKLVKRAAFGSVYFDDDGLFLHKQFDEQLGRTLTRKVRVLKPTRDLFAFLSRHASKDDADSVRALHSLLTEMFILDPTKRITPSAASNHRFCKI